jgi:hypothetical protein
MDVTLELTGFLVRKTAEIDTHANTGVTRSNRPAPLDAAVVDPHREVKSRTHWQREYSRDIASTQTQVCGIAAGGSVATQLSDFNFGAD